MRALIAAQSRDEIDTSNATHVDSRIVPSPQNPRFIPNTTAFAALLSARYIRDYNAVTRERYEEDESERANDEAEI